MDVLEYSEENLLNIFSKASKAEKHVVESKSHLTFFYGYFGEIGAKTIVIEHDYIDHDYLDDYAEYYVRCFKDYSRKCTRLHFFKNEFTHEELNFHIIDKKEDKLNQNILQNNYLGFIVVKPLPITIIGRTCLTTYEHDGRRYFPIVRTYHVNLYGLKLEVRKSLAFQEQDTAVAACATSALWSVFQGTGLLFHHAIPSPSEITHLATDNTSRDSRAFPSNGLRAIEMAQAIKAVKLEPHHIRVSNEYLLKTTLYAYLRAGIPLLLGFDIYSSSDSRLMGKHAVAITGYSLGGASTTPITTGTPHIHATRIDKIYVHDDQVGTFARMEFDGERVIPNTEEQPCLFSISTSWGGEGRHRAVPDILLIPLYNKIRIPFETIHDLIFAFDDVLRQLSPYSNEIIPQQLEWDIYLTTVNELKSSIRRDGILPDVAHKVLFACLPKYIWRAQATFDKNKFIDLFFDATDIEQGCIFLSAIDYSTLLKPYISTIMENNNDFVEALRRNRSWQIYKSFSD